MAGSLYVNFAIVGGRKLNFYFAKAKFFWIFI